MCETASQLFRTFPESTLPQETLATVRDSADFSADFSTDRWAECSASKPIWNAIQAEALENAGQEPYLSGDYERLVIRQPNIARSLGQVLGEALSPHNPTRFVDLFSTVTNREPQLIVSVLADLQAIRQKDPATTGYLNPFLHFKGFHALQAHRLGHWLWNHDRRELAFHLQSRVSQVYGVDIHPAAVVGRGVFVDHASNVVIGETATVGDNVVILHGVTLGGTGKHAGDRHPKVGNGVFIGAGAQLLGNITIGEGAKIGAGSIVLNSVPPQATAVGVAAITKLHPRPGDPKAKTEAA